MDMTWRQLILSKHNDRILWSLYHVDDLDIILYLALPWATAPPPGGRSYNYIPIFPRFTDGMLVVPILLSTYLVDLKQGLENSTSAILFWHMFYARRDTGQAETWAHGNTGAAIL